MFAAKKQICSSSTRRAVAVAALMWGIAAGTLPTFGANNDVTISNGGLSVTFNLSSGAVVTGIANSNVANGLNIVDSHDNIGIFYTTPVGLTEAYLEPDVVHKMAYLDAVRDVFRMRR